MGRRMVRVVFAVMSCFGSTALGGPQAGPLPHDDPEAVALGSEVYEAHCASCHGADLQGEPGWQRRDAEGYLPAPPHDETGHTWHHPDTVLLEIVRRGTAAVVGQGYRSRMPGYAGLLSEEEIRAVLAFIKSTWPDRVITVHDRINAEAAD